MDMLLKRTGIEQSHLSLLELPYEVRLLIYEHVFHDSVVHIGHKTKEEYQAGDGGLHKTNVPKVYNIVMSCKLCYREARPLFCSKAIYIYDSPFSTRNITTFCSTSMAQYIKRLFNVAFLCFEDFERMNDVFPRLEVLGLVVADIVSPPVFEHDSTKLTYENFFEEHLPQSQNQVELLQYLRHQAHFRSFISLAVKVTYFGDNSRDVERMMPIVIDVKSGKIFPGAPRIEQRIERLVEIVRDEKVINSE